MSDRVYYSREAEERAARQRMVAVLVFLAVGLGIGAAVAMLFTPEGKKARLKAGEALGDGLETGKKRVSKTMHQLEDEYPGVLRKFENLLKEIR
jgi:hypothetical protein